MTVREVHLHLTVVVPHDTPVGALVAGLVGRELPAVPGSWIAAAVPQAACSPAAFDAPVAPDLYDEVLDAEADADAGLSYDE